MALLGIQRRESPATNFTGAGTNYVVRANSGAIYHIYISASNDAVFSKSVDGGFTWDAPVDIRAGTVIALAVCVHIDNLSDWAKYEVLAKSGLEMVTPEKMKRPIPEKIDLIICDFDGVITDNRVWVDQD